jgi:hypothetical protein
LREKSNLSVYTTIVTIGIYVKKVYLLPQIIEHKKKTMTYAVWKCRSWLGTDSNVEMQDLAWDRHSNVEMQDLAWDRHNNVEMQVLAWDRQQCGNAGPGLGQTQQCGRVKQVNGTQISLDNWISNCNRHIHK